VEDSPNSAGVVVDAVRCIELARQAKIAGSLDEVSAALMKRPRKQMTDEDAAEGMDRWIARVAR
jgi:myo-inositol-1-phosphate synthase